MPPLRGVSYIAVNISGIFDFSYYLTTYCMNMVKIMKFQLNHRTVYTLFQQSKPLPTNLSLKTNLIFSGKSREEDQSQANYFWLLMKCFRFAKRFHQHPSLQFFMMQTVKCWNALVPTRNSGTIDLDFFVLQILNKLQ